ncbi:Membrane steroid-binding protein 1 [Diplodia seriata]|uniref:Membrane steroid-binding protein 1 n=1 Tax=Diplodia seriata TaxID=420778 RepID=A0A1S8BA90_9PEZI|nr:Membrane steroid-binding protein 1 [Diplodia seriata]
MAEVRQRKANASSDPASAPPAAPAASDDPSKKQKSDDGSSSKPGYDVGIVSVALAVGSILLLTAVAIGLAIHFLDPLQYLDLDDTTNNNNNPSSPSPSPSTAKSDDGASNNPPNNLRTFTPATLLPYTGQDPTLPIYLSINATVYDVSASPSFYGPGGPYAHFAGRDATRAWITECFGATLTAADLASSPSFAESQLTHDTRGVESIFLPLWLDEALGDAAAGAPVDGDAAALFPMASVPAGTVLPEKLRAQAAALLARMPDGGVVGPEERAERREADAREAREAVEKALGKWVAFFAGSGKYRVVGRMVFDGGDEEGLEEEGVRGDPPALCEKAKRKRPVKGGRLEGVMGMMQKMMEGGGAGAGAGANAAGAGAGAAAQAKAQMPEFVRQMLEKREREKKEKN